MTPHKIFDLFAKTHAALRVTLLAIWLAFTGGFALAHSYNESYIYFDVSETRLSGQLQVTMTDLAQVMAQDASVETPMSKEAFEAQKIEIFEYFEARMKLFREGAALPVSFDKVEFLGTEIDTFAIMHFNVLDGVEVPHTIEMSYDALFSDIDPTHRGFALIGSNTRNGMEENESYISLIFAPGDGVKTLFLNDERPEAVAKTFLVHGVWHIWLGFDHVLFLIALLISSVMVINAARWEPSASLGASLRNTVKIVTVFTLAHTVTLTLATFEIVTLPVVFVEAVIAISIAVVALGNLFPKVHTTSWKVVFIFGLFHGFGFANVLAPLGLDPARKALGLLAFNIGVELGQLAIVLVVFPIFFLLRRLPAYRIGAMQVCSAALIAIALFWFTERTIGFGGDDMAALNANETVSVSE